jgi:hypothetical protein
MPQLSGNEPILGLNTVCPIGFFFCEFVVFFSNEIFLTFVLPISSENAFISL